jgi:cyanophycinase
MIMSSRLSPRFGLLLALLLSLTPIGEGWATQPVESPGAATAIPVERPAGPLLIAGGEFGFSNPGWVRFVELAGGKGASIAVIPTASGNPEGSGGRIVTHLRSLGAEAFLVPLIADKSNRDRDGIAGNPVWVDRVRQAGGIYFIGGDQTRIYGALHGTDGKASAMMQAIRAANARGSVVGGSSAGAAIMSTTMFTEGPDPLSALQSGLKPGEQTGPGLGFIGSTYFVDQHFLARGRFARTLPAMRDHGYRYGLGIDEDTALVITGGRQAEVFGRKGVILLDLTDAKVGSGAPFTASGVRLSYIDSGDVLDLDTRQVTPGPRKRDGNVVEPAKPGFKPYYELEGASWYPDMLGPGVLYDAMAHVLDSSSGQAEGIAFARPGSGNLEEVGFRFRFSRSPETRGWFASNPASYTILNVQLEVQPVRMAQPLFSPWTKP